MSAPEFDFYDKTVLKSYNLDRTMRDQLSMLDSLDVVEDSLLEGSSFEESFVEEVPVEAPVIYDLMGRRVLNPTNGVYIVNGKKVIVK